METIDKPSHFHGCDAAGLVKRAVAVVMMPPQPPLELADRRLAAFGLSEAKGGLNFSLQREQQRPDSGH